ncbi:hypothetical protein TNCV_3172701 [Trichonephila clavipes]|nr:hypothetical protein TNCV_3172701 [Trichonephila clavipes]
MQASHLRFMERRTFDNISGVFRISPAAALMRATSSSALFTGVSNTKDFICPRRNNPDRNGLAIGRPMHWTSTVNLSFTTCCIQVIPNRNTENVRGSILLEPHGNTSRSGNVRCPITLAKLVPRISGSVDQSGDQAECRVLLDSSAFVYSTIVQPVCVRWK